MFEEFLAPVAPPYRILALGKRGGGCRALLEVTGIQRLPNCRAGGAWFDGSCPHFPLCAPLRPLKDKGLL
jgi:hypothetical protein